MAAECYTAHGRDVVGAFTGRYAAPSDYLI